MARETLIEWGGAVYRPATTELGLEPVVIEVSTVYNTGDKERLDQAAWLRYDKELQKAHCDVAEMYWMATSANYGFLVAARLRSKGVVFVPFDYGRFFDTPAQNLQATYDSYQTANADCQLKLDYSFA
jgi:hypothetical protein